MPNRNGRRVARDGALAWRFMVALLRIRRRSVRGIAVAEIRFGPRPGLLYSRATLLLRSSRVNDFRCD
jgi:hypothetical protein